MAACPLPPTILLHFEHSGRSTLRLKQGTWAIVDNQKQATGRNAMEYAVKGEARDGRIVILARGFELIRGRRGSPRQNVGLEARMDRTDHATGHDE